MLGTGVPPCDPMGPSGRKRTRQFSQVNPEAIRTAWRCAPADSADAANRAASASIGAPQSAARDRDRDMDRKGRVERKAAALLIVAALASGLGVIAYATHLLRRSELQTIDARFSIRGGHGAPGEVALVLIDDATFAELTRLHLHSEFPFPRRYEAQVIDNLRRAGATTIALDIEFAHETDERDDLALFEALGRAHGRTVLAAT